VVESWLAPVDGGPSWTYYPLDGLMNGGESTASRCPTTGALLLSTYPSDVRFLYLVGLRRSLARRWGASKGPPKPPNARRAPTEPGRSSMPPSPPTLGAPQRSRGAPRCPQAPQRSPIGRRAPSLTTQRVIEVRYRLTDPASLIDARRWTSNRNRPAPLRCPVAARERMC
jgi:hypothetical protein